MAASQTAVLCRWCKTVMRPIDQTGLVFCPHCDIPCRVTFRCEACQRLKRER